MVNLFKQKCIISHHTLTIVPMRVEFVALIWTLVEIFYANIRPSSNKKIFFLCIFFLICLLICFALLLFFFFIFLWVRNSLCRLDWSGTAICNMADCKLRNSLPPSWVPGIKCVPSSQAQDFLLNFSDGYHRNISSFYKCSVFQARNGIAFSIAHKDWIALCVYC